MGMRSSSVCRAIAAVTLHSALLVDENELSYFVRTKRKFEIGKKNRKEKKNAKLIDRFGYFSSTQVLWYKTPVAIVQSMSIICVFPHVVLSK